MQAGCDASHGNLARCCRSSQSAFVTIQAVMLPLCCHCRRRRARHRRPDSSSRRTPPPSRFAFQFETD